MFRQIPCGKAVFGSGRDLLVQGDASRPLAALEAFQEQVQAVYIDPPFLTGERLSRKHAFGEEDWAKGRTSLSLEGFSDRFESREAFLAFAEGMLRQARSLLTPTGVMMAHIDWRMSAHIRLLLDRVFGEDCFINEVIWAYESGGRAKRTFSRKHDTIFLYGKTPDWRLEPLRAGIRRAQKARNHMKRGVDENGRGYAAMVVGGKEYRYYDDELVAPGDVWTDVSHLQQRDPERTGWPTQKPLALLRRLLAPCVQAGELAADLCCGSGTTLAAARELGAGAIGVDALRDAVCDSALRLGLRDLTLVTASAEPDGAALWGEMRPDGVTTLSGFEADNPAFPPQRNPMDPLDAWAVGTVTPDGVFRGDTCHCRAFRAPGLPLLSVHPPLEGPPAVWTLDAAGAPRLFRWEPDA